MVNQSETAFRILTKRHGTQLLFTPMIHARLFATDKKYRDQHMPKGREDERPIVAQFCGNDPDRVVEACKLLEGVVDGVDLNCGCPQGIAKRGQYGSYLLKNPNLITSIAGKMAKELKVPVSVKIRLLSEGIGATVELVKKLEEVGVSFVTIHGRTMENKGHNIGPADWKAIKTIVDAVKIPIIANGNVSCKEEADKCLAETGAAAVMSAEAILENPALFADTEKDVDELIVELCSIYRELNETNLGPLKAHLWHALHTGLKQHEDIRDKLIRARNLQDMEMLVMEMRDRRCQVPLKEKFGWYLRHRTQQMDKENKVPAGSLEQAPSKKPRVG